MMNTSCTEVTYIAGLFVAVVVSLVGFLAPYWQVDEILTADSHVEISVGLSYACVREDKGNGRFNTFCKPLPAYGEHSTENNLYVAAVRWLMTFYVFFMVVSASLNMTSICVFKQMFVKRIGNFVAFLSLVFGLLGLALFNVKVIVYQNIFEKEFPEVILLNLLVPGASFYLSCAGFSLFGLICFVELVLRLRQFCEDKRRHDERNLLLRDEIRFVYGSAPFFLSASGSTNENSTEAVKPKSRVETCEVNIFSGGGGPLPVHNSNGRTSHVFYSWKV